MWIFKAITERLDALQRVQVENQRILTAILSELKSWSLPQPDQFKVVSVREENNMLVYKAQFPALPTPKGDIQRQRFVVNVDGEESVKSDYDLNVTESGEFSVPQGSTVVLTLVYVDDSENVSKEARQEFVAVDTIPPDAPGDFGAINLIREEEDAETEEP